MSRRSIKACTIVKYYHSSDDIGYRKGIIDAMSTGKH